ncbi:LOW QUALITY PROTEIN: hypothetical protein CVT26_006621 [Gymnopilus dilepis]|uniref:Haloacid dehalogenase-like hydrolase domain-containing protein 3 n=1 Tax=Gymnopilus dilepis TaxID=231916 RepID=A0A409Y2Z4_9AGAR|nr:LOW QUALITY PROTEIN: hypothetical protein CVT26_006621 [Gymnopilus dilepis]
MNSIRLVTFDALHTLITPRLPIYVQYSQVFEPYIGSLPPDRIKDSFKVALRAIQKKHPSYEKGARNWWREVIRRTAVDAGANEQRKALGLTTSSSPLTTQAANSPLNAHLDEIVDTLMTRFSSRAGYKAFDDAIPIIRQLQENMNIRTAVLSNGDSRIRAVLTDLEFPKYLKPIILSEEEGVEKPSQEIFDRTLYAINKDASTSQEQIHPSQCLHVGDELNCDFHGAKRAGWNALLIRRKGPEGDQEHKEANEDLADVQTVNDLYSVVHWVQENYK